jgi:hypothetical protein
MRTIMALALLATLASTARAGRRPWIYAEDTSMVPDGDVEIESWVGYLLSNPNNPDAWHWWIGPYWSPVDGLEVAALTVITQPYDDSKTSSAELRFEHLSLRWRVIERKFGSLFLKLEGRLSFADDMPYQLQPSIAWAKHIWRFGFAASMGYAAGFQDKKAVYQWLTYRAAISFDVVRGEVAPPFQLGLEMYSQEQLVGLNDLTGKKSSSVVLGPTLAVAKGRLWLTLGALAGLTHDGPRVFVRGIIGLSL